MPRVSVVIPNWNGLTFLKVVLPSLKAQTFTDFETIVVDNGSDDGSREYLAKDWPKVNVIALPENRGFAPAVNEGIKQSTGEFVALVNNDLELEAGWLAALVEAIEAKADAVSVTGKMLRFDQRDFIDDAGDEFSWHGLATLRGAGRPDDLFEKTEPIFAASGGASLFRRTAFEQVGLLDDDFFAYLEDVDWGFRAQLAGWHSYFVPTARSYHMGSQTSARITNFSRHLGYRNTVWLVLKNYPLGLLIRYSPKLLFFWLEALYVNFREKRLRVVLKAYLAALPKVPRMLGKRWRIQRSRKVSNAYLKSIIRSDWPLPSRIRDTFRTKILRRVD